MAYRIFTIPLAAPDQGLGELNQFLATHQVLEVDRQFHASGNLAFWCFCVSFATAGKADGEPRTMFGKIDYKKELNDEDFAVFCQLRDLRKQVADEMSMPVFAIFSNEQLAQMSRRRCAKSRASPRRRRKASALVSWRSSAGPRRRPTASRQPHPARKLPWPLRSGDGELVA